jgi:hypothetical protein
VEIAGPGYGYSHRAIESMVLETIWPRRTPDAQKSEFVAMARRLIIDFWRYLEQGIVPAGARLKAC